MFVEHNPKCGNEMLEVKTHTHTHTLAWKMLKSELNSVEGIDFLTF